jgi:hypothetical protein
VAGFDFSVTAFAFATGLGDSFDSPTARFALRIGGDSSGVEEAARFFFDFFAAGLAFATGLGDFAGFGEETPRASCCSEDSSR